MDDDLFPASDFDAWAPTYDADVAVGSGFPFDGYQKVLQAVLRKAEVSSGMRVLDLGAGTGNLTALFAQAGCQVWGTDYSAEMVALARRKFPNIPFIQADIRAPWTTALSQSFDRIVSAYAFHHFDQAEKVAIIDRLARSHLVPGGRIVIADIAFVDQHSMDAAAESLGSEWEVEFYWVASEDLPALAEAGLQAKFKQISPYAGVFTIQPGF